jgi:hypothetical protein
VNKLFNAENKIWISIPEYRGWWWKRAKNKGLSFIPQGPEVKEILILASEILKRIQRKS